MGLAVGPLLAKRQVLAIGMRTVVEAALEDRQIRVPEQLGGSGCRRATSKAAGASCGHAHDGGRWRLNPAKSRFGYVSSCGSISCLLWRLGMVASADSVPWGVCGGSTWAS